MTTSSQTPGPMPPEIPAAVPSRTTYDDPWQGSDVPHALRSPFPEPRIEGPTCVMCEAPAGVGDAALRPDPRGRRYPSGAQVLYCTPCLPPAPLVQTAAGVIAAAIEHGASTPAEIAQAEADAGIIYDPQRVEEIAAAAAEQAHAEDQAEIAERGRQLARMAGDHRKINAVARLLEARRADTFLPAVDVARAIEWGTTALDAFPMTLTWRPEDGVDIPGPGDTGRRAIVPCRSSYGQLAHLVVEGDDRTKLATLVDAEFRDVCAPCPTDGCGEAETPGASYPLPDGWARLEIAGVDGGLRAYCSPTCVGDAFARAADELSADDRAAAIDPDQQDPEYLDASGHDDVARCVRCGCTEDAACEGGCAWVLNAEQVDLCSACATPAELAANGWQAVTEVPAGEER
ncbi:hypothetical protein ACWD4Z_23025 [Streptomyces antibioticus]